MRQDTKHLSFFVTEYRKSSHFSGENSQLIKMVAQEWSGVEYQFSARGK